MNSKKTVLSVAPMDVYPNTKQVTSPTLFAFLEFQDSWNIVA